MNLVAKITGETYRLGCCGALLHCARLRLRGWPVDVLACSVSEADKSSLEMVQSDPISPASMPSSTDSSSESSIDKSSLMKSSLLITIQQNFDQIAEGKLRVA